MQLVSTVNKILTDIARPRSPSAVAERLVNFKQH